MQNVWVLCGFFLLGAAIAPSVLGHDDLWLSSGGTANRYPTPNNPYGVAGSYVGGAGPAYAPDAYNFPNNALATGLMFCNYEERLSGGYRPLDEAWVDGEPNGLAPDGTFDDGGIGGACHTTDYTYYDFKASTPGCPGGRSARGSNGVTDIWIGAACDWKTAEGASSEQLPRFCIISNAYQFSIPDCALPGSFNCLYSPYHPPCDCLFWPNCIVGATETCGADSAADAIDFGYGSGAFGAIATFPGPLLLPARTAVGPPPTWVNCPQADAAEAIFVFDTVSSNVGVYVDPDGADPLPAVWVPTLGVPPEVYPALNGQVWTVST